MSQCVVVCADCGREILSIDDVQRTPLGRIICSGCAQENYTDTPLSKLIGMIETIIIEFLLGVLAGTAFGLLIVKHSGEPARPRKARGVRVQPIASRTISEPVIRKITARPKQREKPVTIQKSQEENAKEHLLSRDPTRIPMIVCPACGLEAPESLMNEHLIASPAHRYKPEKLQPIAIRSKPPGDPAPFSMAEESRESVRRLMQMLVPPRAFGHRHRLRTVDPLSSLVPIPASSQKNSTS